VPSRPVPRQPANSPPTGRARKSGGSTQRERIKQRAAAAAAGTA
jgi:hypothetical protein